MLKVLNNNQFYNLIQQKLGFSISKNFLPKDIKKELKFPLCDLKMSIVIKSCFSRSLRNKDYHN